MQPFRYERAGSLPEAVRIAGSHHGGDGPSVRAPAQFIAGGTNLVDYMRLDVAQPAVLLDLNAIEDEVLRRIEAGADGLRLGALVSMTEAAAHDEIRRRYPVIAESLDEAASPQLRHMASLAGNLLQRTRCEYFREVSWPCNKRDPGSGCAAIGGVDRQHAVLGTSEHCIAAYPGDFAQALVALDAGLEIEGPEGRRSLPVAELHRLPGETPQVETTLAPDELITAIVVPSAPWAARSHFLKVRDRASYAFALASAAVALDMDGGTVREARIALGGVATIPWRAGEAEERLQGRPLDERAAGEAAEAAFAKARPGGHNAFKIELGKQTLVQALMETRNMQVHG